MKGRMGTSQQMQALEDITAEISSAVRARLVPAHKAQDLFARMSLNEGSSRTPQLEVSSMPSSELRRNVTRRRSNERARDSVGSKSVPIQSLVSRKPMERQRDMAYASETKAVRAKESGMPITSVRSPAVTRKLIPSEEEDPIRHKALQEMWILKKALEEDIDEAVGTQDSEDFHQLVEQHRQLNQNMIDLLVDSPSKSYTPAVHFNLDSESFALWLAYDGDEISVVAWPQMSVKLLTDRAVELLGDRGITVLFEQILLRHKGVTLDVQGGISDYPLTSDDIVEVLVSRSIRSPKTNSILDPSPKTTHDVFSAPVSGGEKEVVLYPRGAFEHSEGVPGGITLLDGTQERFHDIFSTYQSASVASRDIFLPPRDIFGAAAARGSSTAPATHDPLFQRSDTLNPELQSSSAVLRDSLVPSRDIFGAAGSYDAQGVSMAPRAQDTFSQRTSMTNLEHQSSSGELRDTFPHPRDISRANEVRNLPTDPRTHISPIQRAPGLSMAQRELSMATRVCDPLAQRVSQPSFNNNSVRPSSRSGTKPEFYGIRKGFEVGVCDSWPELARSISGFPKPEFKTFATWEEAKTYVMQGMWRDMPADSRPYVSPVPTWALPGGGILGENVSQTGEHSQSLACW
jgi:hypothetical protein